MTYNSRLLNVFVKLLREKYPEVSISEILAHAGIEPYEINDEGIWFSQRQVNRFHEKTVELSGNENIAREAGRYGAGPGAMGVIGQYTFGLLGPSLAFSLLNWITQKLTHSCDYQTKRKSGNRVEITVTPKSETQEEAFQCTNRIGLFEAMVEGFRLGRPKIEHPECIFQGGSTCRYIVTWKNSFLGFFNHLRNLSLSVLVLTLAAGHIYLEEPVYFYALGAQGVAVLLFSLFTEMAHRKQLMHSIDNLRDSTERRLELIESSEKTIQFINELGQELANRGSVEQVLQNATKQIVTDLNFGRGVILLVNEERTRLHVRGVYGCSESEKSALMDTSFGLSEQSRGPFVRAFFDKKSFFSDDVSHIESSLTEHSRQVLGFYNVRNLLCCPIIVRHEALGLIAVTNSQDQRLLSRRDVGLLQGVAPGIGVAVQNARLIEELQESFEQTLKVLAESIDARDYLTAGHSEAVTKYVEIIASEIGLPEEEIQMLRVASLLHDYGKIGIPDSILKKNGKLTELERDVIRTHPARTQAILSQVPFKGRFKDIPKIAGAHHERWDGTGYPEGLVGTEIPLGARILAVADFFEAVTAKRHYRDPMPVSHAIYLLIKDSGEHFEPHIVDVFVNYLKQNELIDNRALIEDQKYVGNQSRRKYPRAEYRAHVSIGHNKRTLSGETWNIGAKGMFVLTQEILEIGEKVFLTFTPPECDHLVKCEGTVAWNSCDNPSVSSKYPPGYAIEFVAISEQALEQIRVFIRQQFSPVSLVRNKRAT